jgi:2-oxoglutarate ferredoxin oxidoreductase subunit alpha
VIDKRQERYELVKKNEVKYNTYHAEDCDILVVAYGSVARIVRSVIDENQNENLKIGLLCPLTLWPYPEKELAALAKGKKAVVCIEMSSGQMLEDVRLAVMNEAPVRFYGRMGGVVPTAEEIYAEIVKIKEVL